MILWCAYCQKFLGEREPFNNYSMSHGMCSNCSARGMDIPEEAFVRISQLKEFQRNLFQLGSNLDIDGARKIARECFDFGVRPADFVMGFVSPILGNLTLKPELQLDQLSQLEEFCQELLGFSRLRLPETAKHADPDVLLAAAPGNKHLFEIQFLEMWLTAEGIRAQALIHEKTAEEILKACLKSKPKLVGFSISEPDQLFLVDSILEKIKIDLKPAPLFIAVGHAVKYNQIDKKKFKNLSFITDADKLFLTIKTHLSLGFLYDLKKDKS